MVKTDSFLYRLISYAPRPGRVPWEDFFTEAFVGVVAADRELLIHILEHPWVTKRLKHEAPIVLDKNFEVSTQHMLEGGRPDMVVLVDNEPRLILESKMGAAFTNNEPEEENIEGFIKKTEEGNQLARYVTAAKKSKDPKPQVALVSLAPRYVGAVKKENLYLGNFLWSDVYEAVKSYSRISRNHNQNPRARVLLEELIRLMEALMMKEPEPFDLHDSESYIRFCKTKEKASRLLYDALAGLVDEFKLEKKYSRPGDRHVLQELVEGDLRMEVVILLPSDGDSDRYIRPCFFIYSNNEIGNQAIKCFEATKTFPLNGWEGKWKCIFPEVSKLEEFKELKDWSKQVELVKTFWWEQLDTLQKKGLIHRRE